MKKIIFSTIFISSLFLLVNWSGQTSEVAGTKKHRVNFYGSIKLVANQDTTYVINNTSIDNAYRRIPVFIAPTKTSSSKIDLKNRTFSSLKVLTPQRIDLSEIKIIQTKRIDGDPILWKWIKIDKKKDKKTKRSYIEIYTEYNNGTKQNYLIEDRKKLYFDIIGTKKDGKTIKDPNLPKETYPNFEALVCLEIDYYKDRDLDKKEKCYPRKKSIKDQDKKIVKKETEKEFPKSIPTT